jgi:signal transduction histidine kinase
MRLFKLMPLLILCVCLSMAVVPATADTLYKWVDRNGVQNFSNQPPPAEVESYEIIEGVGETDKDGGERASYQMMMERVQEENRRSEALEKQKAQERAEKEKHKAEAEREKRINEERQRLERRIDDIKNRALGPNFTEGMRRAQIEEIQKQIDELK